MTSGKDLQSLGNYFIPTCNSCSILLLSSIRDSLRMEPELGFHPSTHYSKTRRLGHNGLEVSALGFGAMGLSGKSHL